MTSTKTNAVLVSMLLGPLAMSVGPAAAQTDCSVRALIGDITTAPGEAAAAALFEGGVFTAAGDVTIADEVPEACRIVLPEGAVALPGLHDAHAHLLGIGLREMTLNLDDVRSVTALKAKVAAAAEGLDAGETLYGRGWIETGWPEGRMPTKQDLDEVVDDRPVLLTRADGHAMVVNSAALSAARIDASTEDPAGGLIVRDEMGEATGLLIDTAQRLVADLRPQMTEDRKREGLKRGAEVMAARGWTAVHNMSVGPEEPVMMAALAASGEFPIRVFNYLDAEGLEGLAEGAAGCDETGLVCNMGIKLYVDGALGSRGALLFEPYSDDPGNLGLQLIEKEDALSLMTKALDAGLQVATHAIGDRGNSLVLSWYQELLSDDNDRRWRIEHAQVVRPSEIDLFAEGRIIPSMQPSHAIGDLLFAKDRLGEERLNGAYAWAPFVDSGAVLVSGSDAPVEVGDPRIEIHAATRRTGLDGFEDDHWHPEYALTPEQALASFTTSAAFAVFEEDAIGQIAPGYRADVTVFSADPFTTPWDEVEVVGTLIDGTLTGTLAE